MSRSKDPLIGSTLSGYLVGSCLSRGPLFSVYIAHQSSVDRTVVLKVLSPGKRVEKSVIAAFLDGARQAAKLNHRNIVQVFNVIEEGGFTFVSMELVDGRSLAQIVARGNAVSRRFWPTLIVESCAALACAEEAGIVHAELTPSNLLVAKDGSVKILNLGIAAAIEPLRPTMKKRNPSTVAFLAPEQIASGASSHRADIYALGSSLYFAMAGRPPVRAGSVTESVDARPSRAVRSLVQLHPSAPQEISSLLAHFMELDPNDRPASPRRALAEAQRLIAPEVSSRQRRPKFIAAVALLVVLSIATIVAIVARSPAPTDDVAVSREESVGKSVASTKTPTLETPPERPVDDEPLDDLEAALARKQGAPAKDGEDSPSPDPLRKQDPDSALVDDLVSEELKLTLGDTVDPSIEIGRYRQASDYVGELRKEYPDASLLDDAIVRIGRAAEAEIATTREMVEPTMSAEEMAELLENLKSLESRLPESLVAKVQPIVREITTRRDAALLQVKRLEDAETSVLFVLGHHDLGAARRIVAQFPESPVASLREGRERAAKRIEVYQLAWNMLLAGLEKAKDDPSVTLVAPVLDPPEQSIFRTLVGVHSVQGRDVGLSLRVDENSKTRGCRLLDLHPISLLALLRLGGAEEQPESVEGLGTVLFSRQGPVAALSLVDILPMTDESKASTTERVTRLGGRLLKRSAENLQSLVGLEVEDDAAKEASLVALCDAVDELVARHGPLPYYKEHRAAFREIRTQAVESLYTLRGTGSLFHGEFRVGKSGFVRLDYDFSSPDALKDFVLVRGEMRYETRTLTLAGECRLLVGNPFRTRMSITAHVANYTPTSPNINIAVWTRPEDHVTFQPLEPEDAEKNGDAYKEKYGPTENGTNLPNDYVAFCVGYRLSGETLNQVGMAKAVATMPAFTVVAGLRGIPLHRGHGGSYYTYWAESVGNRLRGAQTVVLELAPDNVRWSAGAITLHTAMRRRRPDVTRWLRRTPTLGSVTLFTNGSTVRFSRLRLETELDPAWVVAERTRRARAEFEALESRHGVVPD